ncbi:MAG: RNA methyltransferase [Betaproteobacteria bacterium]
MPAASPLDNVRVVLCGTTHPGNIGAAARAMKTMGITALYLVQPRHFPDPEANALATRADDVLASARVCDSLDAALIGTVFTVACTARSRDLSHEVLTPRQAASRLIEESRQAPVALVFGQEKHGLTAEEVSRCSVISMIPANPDFTSLNLAAAVQIFAYEVRQALHDVVSYAQEGFDPAPYEDVELMFEHLERTLYDIEFLDVNRPKRLMQRLRRLFQRTRLERDEVSILRGILTAAQKGRTKAS